MTNPSEFGLPLPRWSKSTLLEFERFTRSYRKTARDAAQPEATPEPQWFADHVAARCYKHGRHATRRYIRYVECFFQANGAPNLVQTARIQAILRAPDDFDVTSVDFEPIAGPLGFRRAQVFADASYTAAYARDLRRKVKLWVAFAERQNIDPMAPSLDDVLSWLAGVGATKSHRAVRNARNGLAYYLHRNGVADNVTGSPRVAQLIEGVKRSHVPVPLMPYSPHERRTIVHTIARTGTGLRDRAAVLMAAFTPWSADTIVMLDVEHCLIDEAGAHITSPVDGYVLHVGSHAVEDLDLPTWLGRLMDAVGSGPLFRRVHARSLCFGPERLTSQALLSFMRRAAVEANIPSKKMTERLRALFDLEKRDMACETVIAKYEGRESPRKSQQSEERRELMLLMRKNRSRRRR